MAGLNLETPAPRQKATRNGAPKSAETLKTRKKIVGTNRGSNGNQQSKPRTGGSGSAATNSINFGRQKPRQNSQRSGERPIRKLQDGRASKTSNSGRNRTTDNDGTARGGSSDIQVRDEEEIRATATKTTHLPSKTPVPMQSFTLQEIAAVGPVFLNPSAYGFMAPQQQAQKRPVPRYMLHQPRLLVAPTALQNTWDLQNQQRMLEMENANTGTDYLGIYEEFQKMRDVERRQMEKLGLVDAENITKDLNDAIVFQGTCADMCPVFERVRRLLENNVKLLEKDPQTGKISRARAVKAFSRPAAGQPPPMPSDVRPPVVLQQTLDYIVETILPQLPEAHAFVWDRTRSIRQDFVYQNYYGAEAIDCNERIVRIHVVSLHIMAGSGMEYSQQQELEQLNKALQTLTEIYLDVRNHGGTCPNEPEMRAYHLVSHYRDPELEREVQTLPERVFYSPQVQLALRFRTIMTQNNVVERGHVNKVGAVNLFVEFFRLVYDEATPPLLAFLLETHFNEIRFYALKSLARSYHTKGKAFLAEALRQMLGFDTLQKVVDFVSYYEIDTLEENGEVLVDLCNKEKLEHKYKLHSLHDKPKRAPAYSPQLDRHLHNHSLPSLVNSGHSNTNLHMNESVINTVLPSVVARKNPQINGPPATTGGFGNNGFGQPVQNQSLFGQGAPASLGFGQPPGGKPAVTGSFNLSDFLNSKKSAGAGLSLGGFGQPASVPTTTQPKPASVPPTFDFTANSRASVSKPPVEKKPLFPKIEQKPVQPHPETTNPAPKPTSVFGGTAPRKNAFNSTGFGNPPGIPCSGINNLDEKEKEKEKSKLKNDALGNKNVLNFGNALGPKFTSEPMAPLSNKPAIDSIPTAPAAPKLLKNHRLFARALEQVYNDIQKQTMESEVYKLATQASRHQNRVHERQRIINAFAEELFSAFLAEQTHQAMLASVAKAYYETNLKRRAILRIQHVGRRLHLKHEEKRQRQSEIELMSFKAPSLKRRNISSSGETSFTKRKRSSNDSRANISHYENIHERQEQLQQLWQPIDLAEFVRLCRKGVKAKAENGVVALNCILVAENWNCPYSKWLNTKFSLKVSHDKSHYIHEVQSDDLLVSFRSLPKTNFMNEGSFRNTPFIVFECGLLEEKQVALHKTLEHKLMRDGGILKKITQICNRFSYYKVKVLIVLWDITLSDLLSARRHELLRVDEIRHAENCIDNVHVCDMSSASANVATDLQHQLFNMGQDFTGQLSKRGIHKRAELEARSKKTTPITEDPEPNAEETASITASLKAKEQELLRRGRELQKRKYLSAHITANQSGELTNVSGVFRTPNGSFANQTLMNYNNTILGNNTFLHARDASFLRSFANASVMEESTPMGSPGPRSRTNSFAVPKNATTKLALPKKVQELRDITASIKARYKS